MTPGDKEKPEGRYANHFEVGFNSYEFVIDCGQVYPPSPERIHTRIITSPAMARSLKELLDRSLEDYRREQQSFEGASQP